MLKKREIKWNEARPKRESFNGCFKNGSEGEEGWRKLLILLEASTGIEPVYTDLQSAASPLRQLAPVDQDYVVVTIYFTT